MISKIFCDTPHSKGLSYNAYIKIACTQDIVKYENYNKFSYLCKIGCKNYNRKWSCPPFSPTYTNESRGYKYITVCLLSMELEQFSYIKNDYLKVKAANSILKSRIDRSLRSLVKDGMKNISTGSCRLCKPCKCKNNEFCIHPFERAYSFEALGIDVSKLVNDLFGFELQWYKKGFCPSYTSVVGGLLLNEKINYGVVFDALRKLR